ncbi:MAG: HAD-IIIC family phosphatase [Burkholderiaceae bacterium]|nr:MAG: HAD-IIIC family phosphatase [Burkholderiaceae bacterium]
MNSPACPPDFSQRLRDARAATDPNDRVEQLAALAQFQLGFLETIQLDNALKRAVESTPAGYSRIRLALLGSCTHDHLLPAIRVAGLRRRLLFDVHAGSFGQYRQELLEPSAQLNEFRPDIVLLSLTAREAVARVPLGATQAEADLAISSWVGELRELWNKARSAFSATIVQQTFLDVSEPVFGDFDRLVPGSPARVVARLNDQTIDAAGQDGVLLLDVARASARDGIDAWFDIARWLQGKIEIAPHSAQRYGEMLSRVIGAQRGQSKKCLVLDLDNTMWGGVIGDDGLDGIVLGDGSALGEAHLALQRYAKLLKERGVILAVCSKNEPAIAEAAFKDHPEMALRRSDIAAFVANWNDKAANLRAIAEQLNIGLDSLVFVDDNPAERARVRESLPMVAVPELPADPALYVRCIAAGGYFDAVSFTADDRQRAEQYAKNAQREALRGAAQSIDEYLRALEMTVTFGEIKPIDLGRVAQLINKTNQFNPTTRRCSVGELTEIANLPGTITLQFRLADRFGDNGLISAMVLRPTADDPAVLEIDLWVMSCRVFGRQLEFEAMNIAVEAALRSGVRAIRATYIPSEKNGVVAGLYESLGFKRVDRPAATEGTSHWDLQVNEYIARRTFLERKAA